ncbi:uncharacterized protein MONBRDRAFT_7656 [Monosiga brevicollis MX1]|uniref:Glucose/Sorbosone dehydrogenase domain-containing protein n=1 Tax=Monosiga brevicollis TaxID=81824 RepID=A9UXX5_MONBE|nr:uncharacterized protein MONBRDRAFT_7656 [Monosiga brevicollis MX1]EDQ89761.1 predicted protein [Monosiga brevicollis MX1]|eukprot:XP_001745183.1 hypothetical protein [Monosiga brevicollis MX1]
MRPSVGGCKRRGLAQLFLLLLALWAPLHALQDELVLQGLNTPIAAAPIDAQRILVAQISGALTLIHVEDATQSVYVTIPDVNLHGERGLLAVTVHPDLANHPYVFVYVCLNEPAACSVFRLTHHENSGGHTSQATWAEALLLFQDAEGYLGPYHYGGGLAVTPDGALYVAVGDKTYPTETVTGKQLYRIAPEDVVGVTPAPPTTSIATGMRNPLSMLACDEGFLMFDVGGNDYSNSFEEINGYFPGGLIRVARFSCVMGGGLTGNDWYQGLGNQLIFLDYARQTLNAVPRTGCQAVGPSTVVLHTIGSPLHVMTRPDYTLVYTTLEGQVRRVRVGGPSLAVDELFVAPLAGPTPLILDLGAPDTDALTDWTIEWHLNGSRLGAVSSWTLDDVGTYMIEAVAYLGGVPEYTIQSFEVYAGPVLNLQIHSSRGRFEAGQSVSFSATASGSTSAPQSPQYTWRLFMHHANHMHRLVPATPNATLTYAVPWDGHAWSNDTALRVTVEAHDAATNQRGFAQYELQPRLAEVVIRVVVEGAQANAGRVVAADTMLLDGETRANPDTFLTARRFEHRLTAPASACAAGVHLARHIKASGKLVWTADAGGVNFYVTRNADLTVTYRTDGECHLALGAAVERSPLFELGAFDLVPGDGHLIASPGAQDNPASVPVTWAAATGAMLPTLDESFASTPWRFAVFDGAYNVRSGALDPSVGQAVAQSDGELTVVALVRYHGPGWGGVVLGEPTCVGSFGPGVSTGGSTAASPGGELMVETFCTNLIEQSGVVGAEAGWILQGARYCDGMAIMSLNETDLWQEEMPLALSLSQIAVGSDASLSTHVAMDVAWVGVWDACLSSSDLLQLSAAVTDMEQAFKQPDDDQDGGLGDGDDDRSEQPPDDDDDNDDDDGDSMPTQNPMVFTIEQTGDLGAAVSVSPPLGWISLTACAALLCHSLARFL